MTDEALQDPFGEVAAALALVLATRDQVGIWKDSWTFWTYEVEMFPDAVMAHNNLGALHHERALQSGDPSELAMAESEYLKVLALFPRHANACNNLGLIYEMRGNYGEAERFYLKALAIAPAHPQALANLARLRARMAKQ